MEREFFVYLLASERNGTLYLGVTSNLVKRVWEHRSKAVDGFSKRYGADRLVWFEPCPDAHAAIVREKQIKHWRRQWKVELIERCNPYWRDLYPEIL